MVRIFRIIILLLLPFHLLAGLRGQLLIDSLLAQLGLTKNDTVKCKLLNAISVEYIGVDPEYGVKYATRGLELAKKMNFQQAIALSYSTLSQHYLQQGNNPLAMQAALEALKRFEQLKDDWNVANNLFVISYVYRLQKNNLKAFDYTQKYITRCKKIDNENMLCLGLGNLGGIYEDMKVFDSALIYDLQAVALSEKYGDVRNAAVYLNASGNVYRELHRYNEALRNLYKALRTDEQQGGVTNQGVDLQGIGKVYLDAAKDNTGAVRPDSLITANRTRNLEKATEYLSKSIVLSGKVGDLFSLYNAYDALADANALNGDFKQSLINIRLAQKFKDSVLSADNNVKLAQMEAQYQTDLKNEQISINTLQAEGEKKERWLYMAGIGLLLAAAGLYRRNYTKQKRTNEQLATANENLEAEKVTNLMLIAQKDNLMLQLEEAANMKSKFFANISHELRTPVTLISGTLALLNEDNNHTKSKDRLAIAYSNSRKLQKMVEELLDITRLEQNVVKNDPIVVEVGPLIARITLAFESFIEKGNQTIEFVNKLPGLTYIKIDEGNFEKIVNNIIYNAFKFNKDGGYISVSVAASPDSKKITIVISDSGKGISEEDLPHIFERFYKVTGDSNAGGIGIGLSLVKELTELSGGTVKVASRLGEGTTVTLVFPVVDADSLSAVEAPEALTMPADDWDIFSQKQTVLLVEDNTDMRYYLKVVFGGLVNIAEAENGVEALKWLADNDADLVITDMMMPVMDGKEFVAQLKINERTNKLPVIMLTAIADYESQLGMLRMGIDDYIVKPFDKVELTVRAFNLLRSNAERKRYLLQPLSAEVELVADNKEAEEFRTKVTECVLARLTNTNVSVYDLASDMNMHERQLYRLAKSLTGCTPAQLIKEVRLQKAYELLVSGGIFKISDIAKQVGFDTPAYFAKQFQERFGKSVSDFI
jgi:signal transduction histidine kinase/DNA-binding response OmpR family regulator